MLPVGPSSTLQTFRGAGASRLATVKPAAAVLHSRLATRRSLTGLRPASWGTIWVARRVAIFQPSAPSNMGCIASFCITPHRCPSPPCPRGAGLRGWHVNVKGLRGSPDFYFPREKLVVFTDGCFWHGCQRCGHIPAKNNTFWSTKIERNRERDAKVTHYWLTEGFTVLRLWEHELTEDLKDCIRRICKEMA